MLGHRQGELLTVRSGVDQGADLLVGSAEDRLLVADVPLVGLVGTHLFDPAPHQALREAGQVHRRDPDQFGCP